MNRLPEVKALTQSQNKMESPLLEAEDLTVQYETDKKPITAVTDASFTIHEGEFFGLVGESGCGKSTIAKAILGGLDENGTITGGSLRYRGQELREMSEKDLNNEIRWNEISYIPQGSMNSLDPLQRLSEQAIEITQTHTNLTKEESLDRFKELFEVVGLQESRIFDYPHEFSGGMQQRAIIALSLLLEPSLIIADEPTTALDVIMQDQIFKHLDDIQANVETSMMLITHDISLVFESCERMAIMHAGQVAEVGTVENVFDNPQHPYSVLLQESFPDIRWPKKDLSVIEGNPPQLTDDVDYCTFADRCPLAAEECRITAPPLESTADSESGHQVACVRTDKVDEYLREDTPQQPQS